VCLFVCVCVCVCLCLFVCVCVCVCVTGYQRELTYQHYDGSFSAFGNGDRSGSIWWVKHAIHLGLYTSQTPLSRWQIYMFNYELISPCMHKSMHLQHSGATARFWVVYIIRFLKNQFLCRAFQPSFRENKDKNRQQKQQKMTHLPDM